ncbi:hypothetical protein NAEGRDRAFT_82767 [Naegleria gruberi]|uniref:NAD-dependent epimerase/dehydratase domain-containing protein n=1 Tax=Naegleria gruberi TaxID=5762 RepID=D2VVN4_NAEGR|nr:uncharacterized protein NAEGRDRAFT_82767 [Naegleria gruberi]EFC39071.1 hypothetical protein NAEGRDRAFT_82767 [Naegleria gruberi]|eukprot:XP_002671815.1 hypothetical protein NAEGRDRAFT_82767 [Naegleria gruberi strain NEG-M]
MSTVLVLGANGYIGLGVSQALQRNGFSVHGVIRSEKHEKLLWQSEITPLIISKAETLFTEEKFGKILEKTSVIIDCIGLTEETDKFVQLLKDHSAERLKKKLGRLLFVFTSGIMTYGNASSETFLDENVRPEPTHSWTEKRKNFEFELVNGEFNYLDTCVIRPGFVYGKSGGGIFTDYFNPKITQDGKLSIAGSPKKRWSWVHVDDLGEAYSKVVQVGRKLVSGQLFNIANPNDYPTYDRVRIEIAKQTGWKPTTENEADSLLIEPVPQDNAGLVIFENTVMINPRKAIEVLGWEPKHLNFIEKIHLYYQSWKNLQ